MNAVPVPEPLELPEEDVLELLRTGELEILGLLPYASNATLLTKVRGGDLETLAVYKPRRGEAPLWDFPDGTLCLREYAAWVVDRALGWHLVPPTTLREGPAGFGALQLFVDADPDVDVRMLPQTHPEDLQRMTLFDVVVNNADRKAGHCLVDGRSKLWGVDHGVCFHTEPKLRTVIWVYEAEQIPPRMLAELEAFDRSGDVAEALDGALDPDEVDALSDRVRRLVSSGVFPSPGPGRHVPWPPW